MRFSLSSVFFLGMSMSLAAGQLSTNQLYLEADGMIAGEAEFYHGAVSGLGDVWTEVSAESTGAFANARGGAYMQALPDGDGFIKSFTTGASLDYKLNITQPGVYRLWARWTGGDNSSDSLFAGILELADGPGGAADWYELFGNETADFDSDPWDSMGGFEANEPAPGLVSMAWSIVSAGTYTLRFVVREDGVALDAWILQLASLPAPTGFTPVITIPDSIVMHHQSKASIPVGQNDTEWTTNAVFEVVTVPTAGTVAVQSGGRILYEHTNGLPAWDTFSYRIIEGGSITSSPASVTVGLTTDLRLPNQTISIPLSPPVTSYTAEDAFPGISFFVPTSMESPQGDTNRLYVAERNGRIYVIPNVSDPVPQKNLFLDISDRVEDDGNELGLKGITFHPQFESNRTFFVTYCHDDGTNRRVRLSRFLTQPGNLEAGNTNSEVMLIDQINDQNVHNVNDIRFGPDDYLYMGIGDEGFSGPGPDGENNSQRIDKDIWSAILRIDPDKQPGNLEPTVHSGIPLDTNGLAHFSIPSDNPFIGATQFNGIAVNPADVRTEFYVVGLRNPWQFSFDSLTDEFWVSDVGNDLREEVTIFEPGENGGWVFFEGTAPGPRPDKIPPPGFVYKAPVWEYNHGFGTFEGLALTGGFVYRGTVYPELTGKYICGDFVSGNIWSIERSPAFTNVVRIAGEGGLVQFDVHPATDEIIMLDLNDNIIRRLVEGGPPLGFPKKLSETGLFADLTDLSPNPGIEAYRVNLPFWSDYAIKQRWFSIPDTNEFMSYAAEGNWMFPTGMMWVKHFDLELDRGNSNTAKRIETRVLVNATNGLYGVSYRWNDAGTEATLAPDPGVNFDLSITNQGVPEIQTWRIPSRAECLSCHTPEGGLALSFNTRQLNCSGELGGLVDNQIELLDVANFLDNAIDNPATLPRHVAPGETNFSVEVRARSYLAVNCGYCHMGDQSIVPGTWDGRPFVMLDDTEMVLGEAASNGGDTNNLYLVPGDVDHSIIWNRIAVSNGFTRMPPLASTELDHENIQLVADWINTELLAWESYSMWRLAQFGSTNSPAGERLADPDGDNRSNEEEFLTRTDPNDDQDVWLGDIIREVNGDVFVGHDLYNRSVLIEMSTDLDGPWTHWDVQENNGLPLSSGTVLRITRPTTNMTEFYRFRIQEQ